MSDKLDGRAVVVVSKELYEGMCGTEYLSHEEIAKRFKFPEDVVVQVEKSLRAIGNVVREGDVVLRLRGPSVPGDGGLVQVTPTYRSEARDDGQRVIEFVGWGQVIPCLWG